jgi:transketolase
MLIDKKYARTLSRIGVRATYGQKLYEIAQEDPNVIAMSADLGRSSGLNQLSLNLPNQYVNVGIAEQNLVGVAAGMAKEGFQVFASSFAPFLSMRASEQVRMNLGYMGLPVKLVALGSGVSMGFLGNSHYGLEDIAVMRAIPGMTIVSPADCVELTKVLRSAQQFDGPMYIRLVGGVNAPVVYDQDYTFKIGEADWLSNGDGSICLIGSGSGVALAAKAADVISAELNVDCAVVNMATIKPLDKTSITKALEKYTLCLLVEEHTCVGGLGSAIAEFKADNMLDGNFVRISLPDAYVPTGEYGFVLNQTGLSVGNIVSIAIDRLRALT